MSLAPRTAASNEQALVAERAGNRILHRDAAEPVDPRRLDHGVNHGATGRGGAEHEIGHDAVKRGAGGMAAVLSLERRVDGELDRFEHGHDDLRKPAPPDLVLRQAREWRRLKAVDANRHDHRVRLVGDEAGAVIDFHQAAGDRKPTLGEDDQSLARLHGVDQRAGCHRLQRIERHGARDLQERLHPPALCDAMIDGEDRILVEQRQRQRRIEKAHMVERDDGVRSRLREVLRAPDLKPVDGPEQDGEKVAEGAGRHGAADRERRGEAGAADDEEKARGAEAGLLQHGDREPAGDHEGGVEDVDGRHHAGAPVGARPGLHGGEGRNNE